MPSSLRDPKTLADWIELDYFRRPSPFRRAWPWALGGTLLACALVAAWYGFVPGQRGGFQSRPVSTAHALFNNDCAVCHTEAFATGARLLRFDPGVHSVPDSACTSCHSGAKHHETQVGGRACADCHKEHRGHAALARLDDRHCTSCHADLRRNDGQPPRFAAHVTAFTPGRHPEFRPVTRTETDPGTLRFNHAVHLAPAGVWDLDREQLRRQNEQAAKQGGGADADRLPRRRVKPECQSCHEPDEAGRYMKPIRYDAHCGGCHPLSVRLIGAWDKDGLDSLARRFAEPPVPHPSPTQTAAGVRGVIRDRLTRFIADKEHQGFLGQELLPDADRGVPGAAAGRLPEKQGEWVNEQQAHLERLLFDGAGGCAYCHQERGGRRHPGDLPDLLPTRVTAPWRKQSHATFQHQSHRMLLCTECHKDATASPSGAVSLPAIETCWKCHDTRAAKARADCVECHTYHDPAGRRAFRGGRKIE